MMNKLAMSTLMIAGLFQATGCIIVTDDDDPVGASFSVTWDNTAECPAGASAHVISQDTTSQETFTDIYNCVDGAGLTAPLALGDYNVWVEIRDEGGSQLFAQSNFVTTSLDVDGVDVGVAIPSFPFAQGFFGFTWTISDGSGSLSCADAFSGGAVTINTHAGTTDGTVDVFNCEDGTGTTGALDVGTYTVVMDLLDENDAALASTQAQEASIDLGNHLNDLGQVDFVIQ